MHKKRGSMPSLCVNFLSPFQLMALDSYFSDEVLSSNNAFRFSSNSRRSTK